MIRRATTLIEVLVAIFVMGLGLLALLTLFPLGVMSMAQAVKDDRAAHAVANAAAIAEFMDVRNDSLLFTPPAPNDVFIRPVPGASPPDLSTLPNYNGPSYPVFVDPLGLQSGSARLGQATVVGAGPAYLAPGIPRRGVSFVANDPQPSLALYRWFTLPDDMNFIRDGPGTGWPCPPGGVVEREGRYSWAYLLCRPRFRERSLVDVSVVVYSGRPLLPLGESVYAGVPGNPIRLVLKSNTVTISWNPNAGQVRPPIRNGTWLLDATMVHSNPAPPFRPDPHGHFYRVVSVAELGLVKGFPAVEVELQTDIRAGSDEGVLVVMENAIEVFEKGLGWRP